MKLTSVLAAFLGFGATAFAADPRLMNLVMPDVKVLAGVNVTSAKNSPLGQFLISRLPAVPQVAGFNPLQDVTEVLAASAGNPGTPTGLLLMEGTFDPATLISALSSAPNHPAYNVAQYKSATLVTFPKGAAAFLGTTIAIAGDPASVTAALDRSTTTNTMDPALASQVAALSVAQDAWLVSTTSPGSLLPANAPAQVQQASQFLANIQAFSGGVKFGQNIPVTLDVVANSPQNAEALGNVVKLLLTMVSGNSSGPQSLLQSLAVNTSGSTLDLSLTVPEAQIEALLAARKPAANE